jgi:hypothetical protein
LLSQGFHPGNATPVDKNWNIPLPANRR